MPALWLIVALAAAMLFPTLATWLYFVHFAGSESMRLVFASTKCVQFAFPLCWAIVVERQRRWCVGDMSGRTRGREAAIGLASGTAIVALMFVLDARYLAQSPQLASVSSEIAAKLREMQVATPGRYVALAVFYSLAHSLLEEYYWRWFVFGRLRQVVPLAAAIVLSSLGFMAHHTIVVGMYFGGVTWMTAALSLCVAVGGAFWAWLYQRSGTLVGPWLSHLLVDAGLMALGYQMVFCRG